MLSLRAVANLPKVDAIFFVCNGPTFAGYKLDVLRNRLKRTVFQAVLEVILEASLVGVGWIGDNVT